MEVLILSKTKYGTTQVCVGGMCIKNKQFIRLLNQGGFYQPADTKFNIGDIWDITFSVNSNRREPHNEDVTIQTYKFVKKIYSLESYIKNMGVPIWRNNISNIFEGKILWQQNGKGYFSENIKNYPSHSVGFWISDVDLIYAGGSYNYNSKGVSRQIVYKGSQTALQVIPKGKLIRLSLAKWWKPSDSNIEARCYLQLSGWYEDQPEPIKKADIKQEEKVRPITNSYVAPKAKAPVYQARQTTHQHKNTDGSCYIATLCYDDFYADEVCTFRDFRDVTLSKTKLGRKFITYYYLFAPKLTARLYNHKILNKLIKYLILNPLLKIIKTLKLDIK
jgi:hypothetical protein